MALTFYCREDELKKLNKRYADDKFECIVIYGRRRVGKTVLINEFCKDKPTIFSALNTTGKENLEALSKSIMSYERPDMESAPEFKSYDSTLDELTALSKDERIVFVIDEYPYLAKAQPAISAMLQHIIDYKWVEPKMCKYRNKKIGVDEFDLLRDYVSVFGKGNNYHYYIFSKGDFTDGLLHAKEFSEAHLISLIDLYK